MAEAERDAHQGRAWLAWTTAALGRVKRFPRLDKLLGGRRRQQRQSPTQMEAIARAWAAATKARPVTPTPGAASRRVRDRLRPPRA